MRSPSPRSAAVAAAAALLLSACAASRPAPAPIETAWVSPLHRDHPLAGRIWSVGAGRFASSDELLAAVARTRLVFLGEVHDNADHHRLEALLLQAATRGGRRPTLAMEMLDPDQQWAVNGVLSGPEPSPAAFREAVGWDQSGWPPFALYRPVLEVALRLHLPIAAVNLSRRAAREVIHRGPDALSREVRGLLERAGPLSPDEARERRERMEALHCGQLPEEMLDPMVLAQRARDAEIASRFLRSASPGGDGAVLITGGEHARKDRGAAGLVRIAGAAAGEVLSVGFLEVDPAETSPAGYGPLAFDWVVFTPGADRGDPCEGMRGLSDRAVPPPAPGAAPPAGR